MKQNKVSQYAARYAIYGLFVILLLVTMMTGQNGRTMMLNHFFLAVMFVLVAVFNRMGIRRLQILTEDLEKAAGVLAGISGSFRGRLTAIGVRFRIDSVAGDWKRFSSDWENSDGAGCELENYINEEELLDVTHAGLCSLVPGFLTSLGILGTFIGLVAGLGGINFADYDQMTQSVEGLIGGLYVAFFTSIYGISLSIFFNFSFRYFSSDLSVRLDHFYDAFHEQFHGVTQKSMMDELTDNQAKNLSQMETAVAYLGRMDGQLSGGLGRELGSQISESLIPEFRDINLSLQGAMENFREAQDNALGKIVDEFVAEMQGLMQEPIENMSRSLEAHVHALGTSVQGLSDSQARMTERLADLIEHIENTSSNTEKVNENSARIIQELGSYVERLNLTSEASTRMVESMTSQSAALMGKLDTYSQNMNDIAQEQKKVLGDLSDHEERLNTTFAGMEKNQAMLSGNIVSFSESASELARRQADPINLTGIERILEDYTRQADKDRQEGSRQNETMLQSMLELAAQTMESRSGQMKELQEILAKIEEYQENTRTFTGRMASAVLAGRGGGQSAGQGNQAETAGAGEIAQLIAGQQAMAESLARCISLLEADQERRNRPVWQRAADFFRGFRE